MNPFIGIDFEQVREDELYDGINVLVTSEVSMKDEEVIHQYHQLTHIEEYFRKTKTKLDTRPIYVRNDSRIEAHFLTCYIALTMLKILEHKSFLDFLKDFKENPERFRVSTQLGVYLKKRK